MVFKENKDPGSSFHFLQPSWITIENRVRYKAPKFVDTKVPLHLFETFETFDIACFDAKSNKLMTYAWTQGSILTWFVFPRAHSQVYVWTKSAILTWFRFPRAQLLTYAWTKFSNLTWFAFPRALLLKSNMSILTWLATPRVQWFLLLSPAPPTFHLHLQLGPEFSSDIAGDGPTTGRRLRNVRTVDPLLHAHSSVSSTMPPSNVPPPSSTSSTTPAVLINCFSN